jgi:hypothetical protein
MPRGFTDYSKFDKLDDYDPASDEEDWKLSEAEKKARQEKKRDALIQHELDGYKLIDEKLAIAEKLPPRMAAVGEYAPVKEATNWSEGRKRKTKKKDKEKAKEIIQDHIKCIEAVLGQLCDDDDFQRDLNRASLVKAIKHWTNENRLSHEEANELFSEDSIEYRTYLKPALAKIMRLSAACKQAGIGVPIDAVFKRRKTIWERPHTLPEPTPEERKKLEKEARDRHYTDWEKKMFKNLPPPEPFSWKKLLKQCAVQLIVMAGAVLYMKFYMQPKLEADLAKQMKILEQQRLAEFRANQTDFSAVGDGELEVIYDALA